MMKFNNSWMERLGYYGHNWIINLQSIVLKICLLVVYVFGIGFTFLIMPIFGRRFLIPFKIKKGTQASYWMDAKGYSNEDENQYNKQV